MIFDKYINKKHRILTLAELILVKVFYLFTFSFYLDEIYLNFNIFIKIKYFSDKN
jgi:hypothetical protein